MKSEVKYHKLILLGSKLNYTKKAFLNLSNTNNSLEKENKLITYTDALIKQFELLYDLTWKYFKQLLKERFSIEANSPRKVFQDCFQQKLLTNEETNQLIEMIDSRNQTTHVYDETVADDISKKILVYYNTLDKIIKKFKVT